MSGQQSLTLFCLNTDFLHLICYSLIDQLGLAQDFNQLAGALALLGLAGVLTLYRRRRT